MPSAGSLKAQMLDLFCHSEGVLQAQCDGSADMLEFRGACVLLQTDGSNNRGWSEVSHRHSVKTSVHAHSKGVCVKREAAS